MKILVIAEKPDMGKKIAMALKGPMKNGKGCVYTQDATVSWAIGHLLESGMPGDYDENWKEFSWKNLPMVPTKWITKVTDTKKDQFRNLKALIAEHDMIVNAGDPGREGQLIVDEILDYLKCKKPVKRLLLPELRPAAIQKAWAEMQDNKLFFNLYQAGLARGYADWLVGLNGTPAYTLLARDKGYKGLLSVGRVQSPTLAIVVRRDLEIENFVPKEYLVVKSNLKSGPNKKVTDFFALWKPTEKTDPKVLDEEKRLIDAKFAASIVQKCTSKAAKVIKFEIKDGVEPPPLPFSLSKLQHFVNSKYSIGAKDILDSCQALYEKHEAQSYPRSDCQYLPQAAHADGSKVLSVIAQSFPEFASIVAKADTTIKHKVWDDTKLTDHYAIIPTVVAPNMGNLTDKEKKVYRSVAQRYIAQFFPLCKYKTATIEVEIEGEVFRATGKIITDPGWKAVYLGESLEEDVEDAEGNQKLPDLAVGDILHCDSVVVETKKTKPPAYFTEGTLPIAMAEIYKLVNDPEKRAILKEKKGIGREATRTQIIENLIKRGLINKEGKKVISSPSGRALISALPSKVTDPVLTAIWEDGLDKIAEGKVTLDNFMQKQIKWVTDLIEQAKTTDINISATTAVSMKSAAPAKSVSKSKAPVSSAVKKANWQENAKIQVNGLSAGDVCPKCSKGKMVERVATSSGNKFLGCNNYPKCNYSFWPPK